MWKRSMDFKHVVDVKGVARFFIIEDVKRLKAFTKLYACVHVGVGVCLNDYVEIISSLFSL